MLTQINTDLFKKTACRYCNATLSESFLNLGIVPLANSFLKQEQKNKEEFVCPLVLTWCRQCALVQLTHAVPPELMFSNYLYVSSTTQTFKRHFAEYAKAVKERLGNRKNVLAVDIGSNDGLLLSSYQNEGLRAVGIEPARNLSDLANENGLRTINRFFDADAVKQVVSEFGKAGVISANNVFAHMDRIQEVCKNMRELLTDDGMIVLEFPYLAVMLKEMLFDMVYHEHLSYISITSLSYLMNQFDFEIFDLAQVASHGGSLRVFIQKKGGVHKSSPEVKKYLEEEKKAGFHSASVYIDFAKRVYEVKKNVLQWIGEAKKEGMMISGYGAPAKANTLISFCGLTQREIEYIVDDNPLKQGCLTPGSKIPVVPLEHLNQKPTDYVIIFAWNFASEIIRKIQHLQHKGVKFIVPLPRPKII